MMILNVFQIGILKKTFLDDDYFINIKKVFLINFMLNIDHFFHKKSFLKKFFYNNKNDLFINL